MSAFVCLNIEPEEGSDDDVDDSKEIQIEEALRHYQIALKFHSQGPDFYEDAAAAYKTLFKSEIFSYPESISSFQQNEDYGDFDDEDDFLDGADQTNDALPETNTNETPSSLPQILYLAYKNHGQFLLDQLKSKINRARSVSPNGNIIFSLDPLEVRSTVMNSLRLLVEATDRDDTDLQLWRLISRLCDFLGSKRLARYCLEAAIETDDGNYDLWPEPQGLDESLATEQLQLLLRTLNDEVAESEISTLPGRKTGLIHSLKKFVDPCPYLPTPPESPDKLSLAALLEVPAEKQDIPVPMRTWESVGKSILLQISKVAQGLGRHHFGIAYRIVLPSSLDPCPKSACSLKGGGSVASLVGVTSTEDSLIATPHSKELQVDLVEAFQKTHAVREILPAAEHEQNNHAVIGSRADHDENDLERMEAGIASPAEHRPSEQQTDLAGTKHTTEQSRIPESPRTMWLPTRKRSSEAAGLPEFNDTGRSKSKRIKARVSTTDGVSEDIANQYEQQLQEFVMADSSLFESAGAPLSKLGVNRLGTLDTLRISIAHIDHSLVDPTDVVAQDLRSLLTSWNLEKSNIFLRKSKGGDEFGGVNGSRNFTAFLENSKHGSQKLANVTVPSRDDGLSDFAESINQDWLSLDQLALAWIEKILCPDLQVDRMHAVPTSMYEAERWPESLKQIVVQILVQRDEHIYATLRDRLDALESRILTSTPEQAPYEFDITGVGLVTQLQHIFEIHLDIYDRITNPSSEVDQQTRTVQLDRLGRWNSLATSAMCKRPSIGANDQLDNLSIRFIWASVLYIKLTDPSARDHVVLCFKDLKRTLHDAGYPVIKLQNNAAMPEVSAEAAEREISSLTTMDFFLSIFVSDNSEPLAIIESLEPMLEALVSDTELRVEGDQVATMINKDDGTDSELPSGIGSVPAENQHKGAPKIDSMVQYLRKASLPLRLYLWQKLGSAYEAIQYPPRVLSCNFRRMELIVDYLQSQDHLTTTRETRHLDLLGWLRDLDTLVTSTLSSAMSEPNAFEFTDNIQLRSSMAATSALQRILHVYVLWKDSVRVGQTPVSQLPRGSALNSHTASMTKLDNLQFKTWMLQYMLVKEAIQQEPNFFEFPSQYLLEHLNLLHHSLGLRDLCGLQGKRFLKLIKSEMLNHKASSGLYTAILKDGTSNWDRDFAQIIFDLHGIKVLPSWWGLRYHGCTPDILDREAAMELLDFVVVHANRMNIKDLAKNELKVALDKIQAAIKLPTAMTDTTFNKRSIISFLKTAINPLDMYRSFRGLVDLPSIQINNESAAIAAKGWYYLIGHLSLAKFRAQNRTIPGPLDDLDNATIYFRQDLELGIQKWETWYRLAQVYDVKIEEYTKWNANKLNTAMEELKALQRNAIHCYTMAVATASSADASLEDVGKMPELYYDFAMRVYASSREPYSMKAFGTEDFERHFNNAQTGMYKGRPFRGMQLYAAWNFSKVLLERAVARRPQAWASWYLLGKCLWKMYDCDDWVRGNGKAIGHKEVLNAFKHAVETAPERRDKEPILEPHYKLLSILNKLVQRNRLEPSVAFEHLTVTSYARKVSFRDEPGKWLQCVKEVLKALRSADKQNWHHRMAARAAHIAYDHSPDNVESAKAAKEELTQQIFTKTMNIQVWRPEHERAGRHFVYTTRYVNFFVQLLIQIGDTTSLESLAKKIRKKAGDFIGHADLWDSICGQYMKLLRSKGDIPPGNFDRLFKAVPLEVFMLNADRLDTWAHQPTFFDSPLIDLIRETMELRKLNSNLMKATGIDDLVGDAYACVYEKAMPEIIARSNDEENRVRMRVDTLLTGGPEQQPFAANTPPPPGDVPAAAAKTRAKGVTRREVQKRAEALVLAASKAAKTVEPEPVPEAEAEAEVVGLSPPMPVMEKEVSSSVPGSVHDSADDESELTEVEEFVDAPEEAEGLDLDLKGGGEGEGEGAEQGFDEEVEGEGEELEDMEEEMQTVEGEL
ncbi:MAG: hypothetical protein Q9195_009516 [Heterodermia aff. obscurata]